MTRIKLKGLHRIKAKGRYYYYHRATKTRLASEFGSAEFIQELAHIEKEYKDIQTKIETKFGTLGFLIKEYRASVQFENLKSRTRQDYDKVFIYLNEIEDMPIKLVSSEFIAKLRDKTFRLKKRRFTNYMLTVFSILFNFGIQYGYATNNPRSVVKSISADKYKKEANRAWTYEELAIVENLAPPHLLLPIMIARYTGLRKGDVLKLVKSDIKTGKLVVGTNKSGKKVYWPLIPKLKNLIKELSPPNNISICCNSHGEKWTDDGFNSSFYKFKKSLERKKLLDKNITFHGLRKTLAQELKENNFTDDQISVALAHADPKVTRIYTRNAGDEKIMNKIVSFHAHKQSRE